MARAQPNADVFDDLLRVIQCDLFELGAELATPGDHDERIKVCQVEALETAIDQYEEALEPLASFILPTGSPLCVSSCCSNSVSSCGTTCCYVGRSS